MTIRVLLLTLFLSILGFFQVSPTEAQSNQNVTFYTPFKKIIVAPGESVTYKIDVINDSEQLQEFNLSVEGFSKLWDYTMKSGGYDIKELAVLASDKKTLNLTVTVPLKVKKGNHRFAIVSNREKVLPLTIQVSEQGSYETELVVDQPNIEGHTGSTFTYRAKLHNRTGEKQTYALKANAPRGWNVTFKVAGQQVASVNIDENNSKDITVMVKPLSSAAAGKYDINMQAQCASTSAQVKLETVITGSYKLDMSTINGLLSSKITAGKSTSMEVVLRNSGSAEIETINLSANKPTGWEIDFDPKTIKNLQAGKKQIVKTTIKASDEAIAGDYMVKLNASSTEASANANIRMAVRTSALWGWIGLVVIITAMGSIIYLFRKFGRR